LVEAAGLFSERAARISHLAGPSTSPPPPTNITPSLSPPPSSAICVDLLLFISELRVPVMARKKKSPKTPAASQPGPSSRNASLNATASESFVGVVIPASTTASSSAAPSPALSFNGAPSASTPATSVPPSAAASATGSKRKRLSVPEPKAGVRPASETAGDEELARQLQADEKDGPPAYKKLNVS
jgi:hypothetical protein